MKNIHIDILKGKENELKDRFEKEGYDWEKVRKELEKIEVREEVDKRLLELEGNVDAHYEYLKTLISNLQTFKKSHNTENTIEISTIGNPQIQENIKEKAINKVKTDFKKQIGKGFFGGFLVGCFEALYEKKERPKKLGTIWERLEGWISSTFGDFFNKTVLSIFGGKAYKNFTEKFKGLDSMLSNEQIIDVKNKLKQSAENIIPGASKSINKIIDAMSYEEIEEYYKILQKGEGIPVSMLIKKFSSISGFKEKITEDFKNLNEKIFENIKKYVGKKYGKLSPEKEFELKKIIEKYITGNNVSIQKINEIIEKKEFTINELYPIIGDGIGFTLSILGKGIISVGDIMLNFASEASDIVKISIPGLGFSTNLETNKFVEKINSMNEDEKAALIGLMYRKGGLFFDVIGKISEISLRATLDLTLPSNTGVDGLKMFQDGLFHGPIKQLENISKLEKAISGVSSYDDAIQGIKNLRKNYQILSFIESTNGDVEKFKKYLTGDNLKLVKNYLPDDIIDGIQKGTLVHGEKITMKTISKTASNSIKGAFIEDFGGRWLVEKGLGFGKGAATQQLNRAIKETAKWQGEILEKGIGLTGYRKLRETISSAKISHLTDKLIFEFETKTGAKTFLKQLNTMVQSSPELVKGIFRKLPIISIVGFSAASDKPFLEEIQKEAKYLIPIIGPIYLLGAGGISFKDGFELKNMESALLGGGLLTLDGYFLFSALKNGGLVGGGAYMIKPITDIYDIVKGTGEFGQKLYKTGKTFRGLSSIAKTKLGKGTLAKISSKGKGIGLIIVGTILGYEYVFANETEKIEKYLDKKTGNLDIEKLRKDIEGANEEEKIEFIKLFFIDFEGLDNYHIFKDTLYIESSNEKIKSDYFVLDDIRYYLQSIFGITNINVSFYK